MTAVLHSSHTPHPGSLLNIHPEFLLQFCFRVVTSPATDQFFDFANVTFVCNTFATNKLNPFFGTRSCVRTSASASASDDGAFVSVVYFVFPVVFYFFLCLLRFSFFFVLYFGLSIDFGDFRLGFGRVLGG